MSQTIEGRVVEVDSVGNLVTDIRADQLVIVPRGDSVSITCDEHQTNGIFELDHKQPEMTFLAIIGSSQCLELVIVGESANALLGIGRGQPVVVKW